MSAIQTLSIIAAGVSIEGVEIDVGTSVLWSFTCLDPNTLAPLNLTGMTLTMSLVQFDIFGAPIEPPVALWTATITNAAAGTATVAWLPTDTSAAILPPSATAQALPPMYYGVDLWRKDAGNNRVPQMPLSMVAIGGVATLP